MRMRKILALDPGPVNTAYVLWDGEHLWSSGNVPNEEYFEWRFARWAEIEFPDCYIEKVVGMGQVAGKSLFDTSFISGRLFECWRRHRPSPAQMVSRKDVKQHFAAANDAAVYKYLQMRFGKKFFKGIGEHERAAFALAVYVADARKIGVIQ